MIGPRTNVLTKPEAMDLDDLTQEIDAPLADFLAGPSEPTLSRLDFEDIEIALE